MNVANQIAAEFAPPATVVEASGAEDSGMERIAWHGCSLGEGG